MIKVRVRGPEVLQGGSASMEREFDFGRRVLWIGRGEEIVEKQGEHSHVLNVNELSKSVSRVHACLLFSPAFWLGNQDNYPAYFSKLPQINNLSDHCLLLIWEFCRPARRILLKDLHSKTGVFQKVSKVEISTGLEVVLGDSRPLIFHHREIYDSPEQMRLRLEWLKEREHVLINSTGLNQGEVTSFWTISFKNMNFILLDYPSRLTIGRSSSSSLVICQASISRCHATLQYCQGAWNMLDGDGSAVSSNGIWQRVRKLFLEYRLKSQEMSFGESTVKLGDIMFSFDIREDYSRLNVSQLSLSQRNSEDESFGALLRDEEEGEGKGEQE